MTKRVIVCCECYAIVFCDGFYDWWDSFSCLFIVFVYLLFLFGECGDWLSWLFSRLIEMIVVFGSAWLNDCLLLLYFLTHFVIDRYDCILRLIVCRVCFERVFDWMIVWIVCRDCLSGLFYVILFWFIVERLWSCAGCFLLNGCDFVRKKKNYGRTVHCNVAVVKSYVKMSVRWFKRLIFWFGCVLFVVKTLLCSERRFANDATQNRLANRNRYFFAPNKQRFVLLL